MEKQSIKITLKVKDSNGKVIQDYDEYLNETITSQSRPAGDNIISGITLTVTINIDTKTYSLTAYYYLKDTQTAIANSELKKENLKNGEKGSYDCDGITGYTTVTPKVEYTVNGDNVKIYCYYTKDSTN